MKWLRCNIKKQYWLSEKSLFMNEHWKSMYHKFEIFHKNYIIYVKFNKVDNE